MHRALLAAFVAVSLVLPACGEDDDLPAERDDIDVEQPGDAEPEPAEDEDGY
jgi:hypothetical protein